MRSLLPLILMSILSMFALLSWAQEEEADTPPVEAPVINPKTKKEIKPLRVISWNFTAVGKSRKDYDRIIAVLSDADIAVLQEVEFTASGESSLTAIANLMSQKTGEKICKGWFKNNSGERARHAYLWRDSRISYVEDGGELKEQCPDVPLVIRVDNRKMDPNAVYAATFFQKAKKQFFVLASVQFQSKPPTKQREREIAAVFKKIADKPFPTLLAGNFKVAANDHAFRESSHKHFKYLVSPKSARSASTANIWVRNISVVRGEAVNMSARFPELKVDQIDEMISAHSPLFAELSFSLDDADVLKSELVRKKARDKAAALKLKAQEPPPPPKPLLPLPIHDDLETEVGD